jgi:hypothetical protein
MDVDSKPARISRLARERDARARVRDLAAEARDARAQNRDQHAHLAMNDLDSEFPARFLSAADRDDAAGDRADAQADRVAARLDLQEMTACLEHTVVAVGDGPDFDEALAERTVIGIAQGLLMAAARLTPTQAFELLRGGSVQQNRPMRDLARDVLYVHAEGQAGPRSRQDDRLVSSRAAGVEAPRRATVPPSHRPGSGADL